MTTATAALVPSSQRSPMPKRLALAGYRGLTREA
jgi:hypothetical protein